MSFFRAAVDLISTMDRLCVVCSNGSKYSSPKIATNGSRDAWREDAKDYLIAYLFRSPPCRVRRETPSHKRQDKLRYLPANS